MYNKIFTKILDSSIWLETDATRLVWITLLAAMDEDGFCQFASVANLARRAVVDLDKCEIAVKVLENPDANSADPANEGRRIERVPGGWMVLNAQKYRELVTRIISREQTRVRVARYRLRNAPVTAGNESVTPSEALAETVSEAVSTKPEVKSVVVTVDLPFPSEAFKAAWENWVGYRKERRLSAYVPRGLKGVFSKLQKIGEARAIAAIENSIAQNYQGIYEGGPAASTAGASTGRRASFA